MAWGCSPCSCRPFRPCLKGGKVFIAMAKPAPKLKLATTTSVHDSGLLDALCEEFARCGGGGVELRVVGTGAALRLGRRGEVDAVLVHNATSELQFMEAGHGLQRREFMTNDFVLVGPRKDPAGAAGDQRIRSQALGGLFFQAGFEPGRPVPGCASGNRLDGCSPGSSRSSCDVFRRRSSGHGCPSGSTSRST